MIDCEDGIAGRWGMKSCREEAKANDRRRGLIKVQGG
jgi:hypothetical protein